VGDGAFPPLFFPLNDRIIVGSLRATMRLSLASIIAFAALARSESQITFNQPANKGNDYSSNTRLPHKGAHLWPVVTSCYRPDV
jgi:hypothetical protein